MTSIQHLSRSVLRFAIAATAIGFAVTAVPRSVDAQHTVALSIGGEKSVPLRKADIGPRQEYRNVTIAVLENTGGVGFRRAGGKIVFNGVRPGRVKLRVRGEVVTFNERGRKRSVRTFQRTIEARVYRPGKPGAGEMKVVGEAR